MNHRLLTVVMAALLLLITGAATAQGDTKAAQQATETVSEAANNNSNEEKSAPSSTTSAATHAANGGEAHVENGEQDATANEGLADAGDENDATISDMAKAQQTGGSGLHQVLKTKFIEGNAGFMSLVALALILLDPLLR